MIVLENHYNKFSLSYEEAKALAENNGEKLTSTFCAMCGPRDACGIYAFTKKGKLTHVAGMKECPVNKGGLCVKGQASPQWLYSPDRIKKPLLRTGEKGEGKFKEIEWDEAVDIIAGKLMEQKEKYGPESLAILSPAKRSYSDYLQRFLIAHGSPNYGHSGICVMQRVLCFLYTIGEYPQCDYKNTKLALIWGRQPFFSGPAMQPAKDYLDLKARKGKIVAIKPSIEPDSGMADEWLPIRPGTDAALALSMLNVVMEKDLIDKEFVEKWCYGYEKLKEHIKQYPPEWGEKITGIPAEQIIETASLYATTKEALIDVGNGVEHSPSSSDAVRSIAMLMAITGHLDRPGCNIFNKQSGGKIPMPKTLKLFERYTEEMVDKLVAPEFPKYFQPFVEGTSSAYYKIFESVLTEEPYPVRTIISPGTQPTVSTRGTKKVIEALKKLDFYVVIDVTRTADMKYADIVLPTTTPYESDHPFEMRGNWIMARNKVVEPLGDFKSIYEFFIELGMKMGYGKDFWDGDMEKCQEDLLSPFGMSVEELRKFPVGKIYNTEAGTIKYEEYEKTFNKKSIRTDKGLYLQEGKVALYSTLFEKLGYAPMPEWHEPPESITGTPEHLDKYPLMMSDYHTSKFFSASWQRNVPYLRELQPEPVVHIHPDTAAERNIKNDDWVKIESPHGFLKVKAELYPGIRPDTVMMLHGWWQGCSELEIEDYPLLDGGANVNHLYSVDKKAFDPLITSMSSQTLVEVTKIEN